MYQGIDIVADIVMPFDLGQSWANIYGSSVGCTEVRFASFLSGGFTTMAVMNPPEGDTKPPGGDNP